MILDEINYTSETGLQQSPEYPETYYITVLDQETLTACPHCNGKLKKRENSKKIIHDYDSDQKRVIIATLSRNQYRCMNPSCRQPSIADKKYDNILRTEAFNRYIALETLKGTHEGGWHQTKRGRKWSNELFGKRYGISRDMVSRITKEYAPALTPLLIPPYGYTFFHLYPFQHKKKRCYYLFSTRLEGDTMLLAVFGYHNPVAEIRKYLELYKDFIIVDEPPVFITDFDPELIRMIKDTLKDVEVAILYDALCEKLEDGYLTPFKGMDKKTKKDISHAIDNLFRRFDSYKTSKEELMDWHELYFREGSAAEKYLPELWEDITACMDEVILIPRYKKFRSKPLKAKLQTIRDQLQAYRSAEPDFEIMAAKIMLYSISPLHSIYGLAYAYTSSIFTGLEQAEEPMRLHLFKDLLEGKLGHSTTTKMILDDFWEHYEDEDYKGYEEIPAFDGQQLYEDRNADEEYQEYLKNDWYWTDKK